MIQFDVIFYQNRIRNYLVFSVLLGAFFFIQSFGLAALNPRNNAWLMHGDWAQCYLGWEFYRNSLFTFPIGSAPGLFYPHGSNIIYTDSVPWFSLLMKPISLLFKGDFQHLGLWFLVCFVLQYFFSFLIVGEFKMKSSVSELLAATVLFVSPLFFHRFGHATLSSHWLVLALIWSYVRKPDNRSLSLQTSLNLAAALTNPYFCVFSLVMSLALLGRLYLLNIQLNIFRAIKFMVLQGGIIILVWAFMGYFMISQKDTVETGTPLGIFSANLNSLWNPIWETSKLLFSVKLHHMEQYEGYGYLGFGIIILIAGIVVACLVSSELKGRLMARFQRANILPLVLACLLLFIYALSQRITFFDTVLVEFKENYLLKSYLSIFRSSGRFIWLLGYVTSAFALFSLHTLINNRIYKMIAFAVILYIQLYDVYSTLIIRTRVKELATPFQPKFNNPVWDSLFVHSKNVIPFPTHQMSLLNHDDYIEFLYKSVQYNNNIATGYLARFDYALTKKFNEETLLKLQNSELDLSTAYVTTYDHLLELEKVFTNPQKAVVFEIDRYIVIVHEKNKLAEYLKLKTVNYGKYPILKYLTYKYSDKIVLISGKDECSNALSLEDKEFMKSVGGNVQNLGFRGSYCTVLYHGGVHSESINNSQAARVYLPAGTVLGDLTLKKTIDITSEGKAVKPEGEMSYINIDNVNYSKNRRGLNVVVLDKEMNVYTSFFIDTFSYGYTFDLPILSN